MENYKLMITPPSDTPNGIQRLSDKAYIPMDEENRDYQEYLAWIEEGNTPDSADDE